MWRLHFVLLISHVQRYTIAYGEMTPPDPNPNVMVSSTISPLLPDIVQISHGNQFDTLWRQSFCSLAQIFTPPPPRCEPI